MAIQALSNIANQLNLHKSNWIGILVWTICVTALTGQLIRTFLPLLDKYQNENVEMQILVVRNESSRPPRLTVCVPYHSQSISTIAKWIIHQGQNDSTENSTCMECEGLKNNSWDLWNQMDLWWKNDSRSVKQGDLETILANAFVTKILDHEMFDLLVLKHSNFNWNQPLVDSITYLMDCIFVEDHEHVAGVDGLPKLMKTPCRKFQTLISRLTKEITNRLFQYLVKSVNIYLGLGGGVNNVSQVTSLSNRNAFLIAMGGICFPLSPDFTDEAFVFKAYPDPTYPPWMRSDINIPFTLWLDDSVLYAMTFWFDAICNTGISKEGDPENSKYFRVGFDISMKAVDIRRDSGCIPGDMSIVECVVRRQLLDTISLCGCFPFSYQHLISDALELPQCNLEFYEVCKEDLSKHLAEHQEICELKCEVYFYKWTNLIRATRQDTRDLEFGIFIPVRESAPYVVLVAQVKDSPEDFLSKVGGIINLYLGFSGMSVCAFIIVLINFIQRLWQKLKARNKGSSSFEQQMTVALENQTDSHGQCVTRQQAMEMQVEIMKHFETMREDMAQMKAMIRDLRFSKMVRF